SFAADNEAAAVEVQQHRQRTWGGPVQAPIEPAGDRDRQVPGRVQGRRRALQAEDGGVRGPDVRSGQPAGPGTRFLLRDQLPQPRAKLRQRNSPGPGPELAEPVTATDIIPRSPSSSQRARVTRPWVLAVLPPIR